jgi:ribosomal protein S18 acetylase RimI-like enzyme
VVRRAGPEDLEAVAGLIAEFRDWWGKIEPALEVIRDVTSQLLDHDHTEFLLAFDDGGKPVGLCQLRYRLSVWTAAEDCWLEDLFMTESARGGGHGRRLVEAAFESARARGCRRIELDVNEQNTGALRFYESLGFSSEPKPPGRTLFLSRTLP